MSLREPKNSIVFSTSLLLIIVALCLLVFDRPKESSQYYKAVYSGHNNVIKIEPVALEDSMNLRSGEELANILIRINQEFGIKHIIPEGKSYHIFIEKEISSKDYYKSLPLKP